MTVGQLLGLGYTRRRIELATEAGRLIRVHHGVYAVGHRPRTPNARYMAAVLACGPGAVLSHRSAAALHGFWSHRHGSPDVTSTTKGASRRGVDRHWTRRLLPHEVMVKEGIAVTRPHRTAIDLADVVADNAYELALRSAERQKLLDRSELRPILGRRGTQRIQRRVNPLRSPLEEQFRAFLIRHGFALPVFNAEIDGVGEVDAAWFAHRVAVELDSYEHHRSREQFELDRERGALLTALDWRQVRLTQRLLDTEPVALFHGLLGDERLRS